MASRMKALPPEEFESILRSAFQEDELLLILIGAVLGALVGLGQAFYMLAFPDNKDYSAIGKLDFFISNSNHGNIVLFACIP